VVLGSALLVSCGQSRDDSNSGLDIINGSTPADNGIIEQSTVALVSGNGQVFCTGTLIDDQYVVSAAHCLASYYNRLYIGFGRGSDEFTYVEASDWQAHPDYSGSFNQSVPADISVIELSEPAPSGYQPVEIYKRALSRGEELYLAGFGQTESGSTGSLLYRDVSVSDSTSSEITVSNGACYGDSGGPAYLYDGTNLTLVGATSRGAAGCRGDAVYTSVRYFESWLEGWSGLNL
jgi:secreted trypsin-like serine protease